MTKTKNRAATAFEDAVAALHLRGRLRVWSLVITLFGDAIVPRGGKVGLSVVQDVMARLNVENGAVRTALSRLAADGWVVREKSGRNSIYALAKSGRRDFDLATKRIYAAGPPEWDGRWTIAIAPGGVVHEETRQKLSDDGFVDTGASCWLRVETGIEPMIRPGLEELLILTANADNIPAGVQAIWKLDETAGAYRELIQNYRALADAFGADNNLPPLDALAARVLLIHDWRRIVLCDPGLPANLLPSGWPGEAARSMVRAIYTRLAPPSEQWLDQAGLPRPVDPARFAERFGIFQSSR